MSEPVVLQGLHATSLLGYLAALGTLVALAEERSSTPRLAWHRQGGQWTAVVRDLPEGVHREALPERLADRLKTLESSSAVLFAKDLSVSGAQFREQAWQAAGSATLWDRADADFMAAFGCDAIIDKKSGQIRDTSFRTMSGAGNQHFLESMKKLAGLTTAADLTHALFEEWAYTDEQPSMRWDARDDRRYALRWRNPSGDPPRTVRGANRLAIEALRLLPTAPVGKGIATTGFRRESTGNHFTWPVWDSPLSVDAVRSVLGLSQLEVTKRDHVSELQARGVVELYRSTRRTVGKYVIFTPAVPATLQVGAPSP